MFDLSSVYTSLTSRPFLRGDSYAEYAPGETLKPYVACYWGTAYPMEEKTPAEAAIVVIPDTCMDLIFEINHTAGTVSGHFSGIYDAPFAAPGRERSGVFSRFAVRFNFWSAGIFLDLDMKTIFNSRLDTAECFPEWHALAASFLEISGIHSRIALVEAFLLKRISPGWFSPDVLNGLYGIMKSRGTETVASVTSYTGVSQRHLERLFREKTGLSIKQSSSLIRYQYLWKDIAFSSRLDVLDAVEKYGFTDQSHLLNNFRKFHSMYPGDAKRYALSHC